ncbi:putative lipid II flippase MurJ [Azorhizobium oxalatiphilum]|uniref:Lipid II flippase MurJ n=1 Tax=Azorhizobium oxalatiphilum TaxID=980631 RepID=A0A917BL26_9HYPH|nr:putative lipid II flippase MurJ [Azorhizobium oxalatiphilum]
MLGVGPLADALMAALSLPLLARRLLAEGAFNAALIPALVRREASAGSAAARPLATATLWLLLALLCLFALLGGLFMPALIRLLAPGFEPGGARADLAIACGRIALLYLPLAGAAAVYGGLANRDGRVVLPSLAPVLANVVVLSAIVFIAFEGLIGTAEAAHAMAIATVAAGIAQLALMVRAARRSPALPGGAAADWRGARTVMRASAPALLFAGLAQLRIILAAAVLSADPGSVSALNYAQRLVDLPLGLVGASAGAVLVPLLVAGGGGAGRQATGAVIAALSLAMPAALGLLLLADPIVAVLYQRGGFTAEDAQVTAALLAMLALALPAQGLERVLAATALTHGLTRAVERIGLGSLLLCLLLVAGLSAGFGTVIGVAGIALSATLSASAMLLLLAARGHLAMDGRVLRQLAGLVTASLLMAATVFGLAASWPAPRPQSLAGVLHLAALIGAGMLVYGGVMLALIRRGRRSGKNT